MIRVLKGVGLGEKKIIFSNKNGPFKHVKHNNIKDVKGAFEIRAKWCLLNAPVNLLLTDIANISKHYYTPNLTSLEVASSKITQILLAQSNLSSGTNQANEPQTFRFFEGCTDGKAWLWCRQTDDWKKDSTRKRYIYHFHTLLNM